MAKRTPPRPKSTANLPAGLKAYWASKGVPSKAPSGSSTSTTTRKKSSKKSTVKKTRKKRTSTKKS